MAKQEVKTVIKDGEEPLPLEVLESAILAVSNIGKQLNASRLKRRAVLLLIRDLTNVPMTDIDAVLTALPLLEERYLKPSKS